MATKLGIFNAALHEIGHNEISDTGEDVEAARMLLSRYPDVVADCLEAGPWNFATTVAKLHGDTGLARTDTGGTIYGYHYGFAKPSDWVRTVGVSDDENFISPLTSYDDDVGQLYADNTPVFLRYVSNDTGSGRDLASWPRAFARYVELELAERVCERLSQGTGKKEMVQNDRDKARLNALNRDAMDSAQPRFPPTGSWTLSRGARSQRDRGNRHRLTG